MTGKDDLDPSVTLTNDWSADLEALLAEIRRDSQRCIAYAASLSRWSLFWNITLIALGAVVAAQGSIVKVWGNTTAVAIFFIALGIVTSSGSAYQALFKPSERSPKFAQQGLLYDALAHKLRSRTDDAARSLLQGSSVVPATDLAAIARKTRGEYQSLRTVEVGLYVTGPIWLPRRWRTRADSTTW